MTYTAYTSGTVGDKVVNSGDYLHIVSGASVAVTTAGFVTISDRGKAYVLNIAGAAVGQDDFVFGGGSVLTETAAPQMAFPRPRRRPLSPPV